MIGKFCCSAALLFAGTAAAPTSTTINVPIVVTHGAPLTTFTFVNNTGTALPAGSPVSFGQGFRYGDIMPGTYPLIRDASTHLALPGQQSTRSRLGGRTAATARGVMRYGRSGYRTAWRRGRLIRLSSSPLQGPTPKFAVCRRAPLFRGAIRTISRSTLATSATRTKRPATAAMRHSDVCFQHSQPLAATLRVILRQRQCVDDEYEVSWEYPCTPSGHPKTRCSTSKAIVDILVD